MRNRYIIKSHGNLNIAFFSNNIGQHMDYLKSYHKEDLHELFQYCQGNLITAFAMSRCRGHVEELIFVDNLISFYQIRMTSTQLSYLGCVLDKK